MSTEQNGQNPYADVNSLYGLGNTLAWLLCCTSAVLVSHFCPQKARRDRITYDLVVAMLYPLWAAFDASMQIQAVSDRRRTHLYEPERFLNKIYAPMTISTTWVWLVLPLLLLRAEIPENAQARKVRKARWRRAITLVVASTFILIAGIIIPLALWHMPAVWAMQSCRMRPVFQLGYEWPILLPLILAVPIAFRQAKSPKWQPGSSTAILAIWSAIILWFCVARLLIGTLVVPRINPDAYAPVLCYTDHLRSRWWIFSILPKTQIPMAGDQWFALTCGFLTLAKAVNECQPVSWTDRRRRIQHALSRPAGRTMTNLEIALAIS